jgi:hypothetical protein
MGRDSEVESVLAEIRQQLRASADSDGAQSPERRRRALAQFEADLAVTGRAWSRLPPVVSDRRGAAARLELWVKRQLRRATNWLTWEQINFNAAANDALRLAHELFAEREEELAEMRARVEALAADLEELRALRAEADGSRASARAGDTAR